MDKTFSPSYFSSQITYVEAEAVDLSRFRFHRKRTASAFTSLDVTNEYIYFSYRNKVTFMAIIFNIVSCFKIIGHL